MVDSYRAVITDPSNPKVYLLLADAWCEMGREFDNAKEALATGRRLCKEGIDQLTSRYDELDKLQREHEEEKCVHLSVCLYVCLSVCLSVCGSLLIVLKCSCHC